MFLSVAHFVLLLDGQLYSCEKKEKILNLLSYLAIIQINDNSGKVPRNHAEQIFF